MKKSNLIGSFIMIGIIVIQVMGCQKISKIVDKEFNKKETVTLAEWVPDSIGKYNGSSVREIDMVQELGYQNRVEEYKNTYVLNSNKEAIMSNAIVWVPELNQVVTYPNSYYTRELENKLYSYTKEVTIDQNGVTIAPQYVKRIDENTMYDGISRTIATSVRNNKSIEKTGEEELNGIMAIKVKVVYAFDGDEYLADLGLKKADVSGVAGYIELMDKMEAEGYLETVFWFQKDNHKLLYSERNMTSYQQFIYYYEIAMYGNTEDMPVSSILKVNYKTGKECQTIKVPKKYKVEK